VWHPDAVDCAACSARGQHGVPGVEEVAFRDFRVEPVRPHAGPYAGTGFRLRRTVTPVFCARHAPEARRLAAERLTLRAALRRLAESGGEGP
jgi:hypothetical protein